MSTLLLLVSAACHPDKGSTGIADSACPLGEAEVVINEFLPDPAGSDDGLEWVELYNAGTGPADLSGWTLRWRKSESSSGRSSSFPDGTSLSAGSFLVVGGSSVPSADITDPLGMGNGTNGDALYLYDLYGELVDAVVYTPDENGDGVLDESCEAASSLADMPRGDESLARCPDGNDSDLSGDDFFVCGSADTSPGSANSDSGCCPTCDDWAPSSASEVQLVINEVLANPAGSNAGAQWVEMANTGTVSAMLSGWTLDSHKSDPSTPTESSELPPCTEIAPGGHLLVADEDAALAVTPDVVLHLDLGSGLNGDALYLRDADGELEDALVYGDSNDDGMACEGEDPCGSWAGKPADDQSLARCPDGSDSDQPGSDFQLVAGEDATPGASNDPSCQQVATSCDAAADSTVVLNELMVNPSGADDGGEWVELYNSGSADADVSGWQVASFKSDPSSPAASAALPASTSIPAGGFLLVAEPDTELDLGNGTNGDAVKLYDCDGALEDVVVYGDSNDDGMACEGSDPCTSWADKPSEGQALARVPDGQDSDLPGADICIASSPTPGASNSSCAR